MLMDNQQLNLVLSMVRKCMEGDLLKEKFLFLARTNIRSIDGAIE
jgi:hypothetical protein